MGNTLKCIFPFLKDKPINNPLPPPINNPLPPPINPLLLPPINSKLFNPKKDFINGSDYNYLSMNEEMYKILIDIFKEPGIIKVIEQYLPCQYCKCHRCGKIKKQTECMFYNKGNDDITVYCLERCY